MTPGDPPGIVTSGYSRAKQWLSNLNVRLFSVTVRTTWSGAPGNARFDLQRYYLTFAPTRHGSLWSLLVERYRRESFTAMRP